MRTFFGSILSAIFLRQVIDITIQVSRNLLLVHQLLKRELETKFKGSVLGTLWIIINPVLLAIVYTAVFGGIMQARLHTTVTDYTQYALNIFLGISIYNLFSETILKSTSTLIQNPTFIKKIVFPLEFLVLNSANSSLINFFICIAVHAAATLLLSSLNPIAPVICIVINIPVLIYALAAGFVLSSLTVFIRDTAQIVQFALSLGIYLTPIFYSISQVPKALAPLININPLSFFLEQSRQIYLGNTAIDIAILATHFIVSIFLLNMGLLFFKVTRKSFADAL